MTIEDLKKKFIVDENVVKNRLEAVLEKALVHCVVDKQGTVHINDGKLGAKSKVKLVLSARYLASQLTEGISQVVTPADVTKSAGVPANQARARLADLVNEKFAESPQNGNFRVLAHKIEPFLDSLKKSSE